MTDNMPEPQPDTTVQWVVTTEAAPWQSRAGLTLSTPSGMPDVFVKPEQTRQTIEGFGAAFNELGWTALSALSEAQQTEILREMFAPGIGGNFTLGRMPIGANDFSRDWYSYDEVDGDFALEHFSVANDLDTLVPFIRAAQQHQSALSVWASPWSPPTWMKTNGHYAGAMPMAGYQTAENGLRPDQVGAEGTDMFIQDDRHLAAYAAYFGRFVDEYRALGIPVGMVMPQNEFNSAQIFPSCTWTPQGLARFIRHLGPEMAARGVDVFLGTLERADSALVDGVFADAEAARHITGLGIQWHGKGAVALLHRDHPALRIFQTEQECGDGRNDWRYARYAWTLMKEFLGGGASAYLYWNLALGRGGVSRWGWSQNSLVTVDAAAGRFEYTHEYHLLKHVSHFVRPGAHLIDTLSYTGYENQLAFLNPDGSIVIVVQNDTRADQPVTLLVGERVLAVTLPADSFSTFVVPPSR
ncbi:glycoside hydrolase family 30 beta sandwich domain-containing protein [Cryobacterium sp.]|jgi:glucosylceramidase|uniref:glycoside hydrolase family 30 protein n=1 Tax=Cryobacterium sp. TaxID=1926290 RepID=UPI00261DC970|nr:glycoside hydrolase family 30 beta sandwich domain-containing protein [Cryobacterium sp.]MCU1445432.1 beta-glycosidase [Cryobacterium sp.]